METTKTKVRITWNGMGGELDSVLAVDDGEDALTNALIKLLKGSIVSPGDWITVQEIER